ncbi:MAG TPA: DUF3147 family protein [Ignavibacteriaceae bacterium]|nr:DUF3147 family protein [Ignavibacteriaceae bacterium]
MLYYVVKILISAILITVISEVSKRSSLIGGILASIPLVSVMAMIWLYIDTQDITKISKFSTSIFWLVIPSLSFFIIMPVLLKTKLGFYPSLVISLIIMVAFYYLMIYLLGKFGIEV